MAKRHWPTNNSIAVNSSNRPKKNSAHSKSEANYSFFAVKVPHSFSITTA